MTFQTLNNRMIAFQPSKVNSVTFLDEADDGVCGTDWNVSREQLEGEPQELYKCLQHLLDEFWGIGEPIEPEFSESMIQFARKFMEDMKLREEDLHDFLNATKVIHVDGTDRKLWVSEPKLADVLFDIDTNEGEAFVLLMDDDSGDRDVFLHSRRVSLISMPLTKLEEGLESRLDESDDD